MVTKKITRVIILWRFTHPSNRSLKFFSFFFKYRFCLVLVSFRCVGNRKSSSRRVISFCNARWVLVASFRGNGFHVRDFYTCKNRDWCEWGCVFWFEWNFLKKEKYCYYFSFQFGFIELRGALYREILLSKMFKLVRLQNETYRKSSRDLLYSIALSIKEATYATKNYFPVGPLMALSYLEAKAYWHANWNGHRKNIQQLEKERSHIFIIILFLCRKAWAPITLFRCFTYGLYTGQRFQTIPSRAYTYTHVHVSCLFLATPPPFWFLYCPGNFDDAWNIFRFSEPRVPQEWKRSDDPENSERLTRTFHAFAIPSLEFLRDFRTFLSLGVAINLATRDPRPCVCTITLSLRRRPLFANFWPPRRGCNRNSAWNIDPFARENELFRVFLPVVESLFFSNLRKFGFVRWLNKFMYDIVDADVEILVQEIRN